MPIALPSSSSSGSCPGVPPLLRSSIQACRFSEWYPSFRRNSIRGVVYKFGKEEEVSLRAWFNEDGMRLPSEVVEDDESQLSDSDSSSDADETSSSTSSSSPPAPSHSFPAFTSLITSTLLLYPIFPKINNLAPQDAQWILPLSQPLKCTTVQDVYLALKASALTAVALDDHRDLSGVDEEDEGVLIEGVVEDLREEEEEGEKVEVVLKKWYDLERSREFRLFVSGEVLVGISQRDPNHYPHLLVPETQSKIRSTLQNFFESTVKGKFAGGSNYVLDVYMSSSLTGAHLLSIAPYHPSLTSPLLFGSYSTLHQLYLSSLTPSSSSSSPSLEALSLSSSTPPPPTTSEEDDDANLETIGGDPNALPVLLVIESRSHPAATRNSPAWPAYPQDVVSVGSGKDVEEFKRIWEGEVREAAKEEEQDEPSKQVGGSS